MPLDIHEAIRILRKETKKWSDPVLEQYAQTPFAVLIACILSLRTQDKTTDEASARLFRVAATPQAMVRLSESRIARLIYPVSFYRTKAKRIREICRILLTTYKGSVPNTMEQLISLPGVGRKTANLVLTVGFNDYGICVDTHVHRIFNRWGFIKTRLPDDSEIVLRQRLPKRYWKDINRLLVIYGQNICRPQSPWCSRCPVESHCQKIGVDRTR